MRHNISIEAMKQAIKALEMCVDIIDEYPEGTLEVIFALRAAIEQAEKQEPVAWITPNGEGFRVRFSMPTDDVPLGWDALYTAPPNRKPLTEEEVDTLLGMLSVGAVREDVRTVEAAHGIKGEAK